MEETSQEFSQKLSESPEDVRIEELAALFFTIPEIALYLDRDADELQRLITFDLESSESRAYRRGTMKTEILLRFETRHFAMKGLPDCVEKMQAFRINQKQSENG